MKFYVDQSGKVEDTNRLTVIACTNGKCTTLVISSTEKQRLVKVAKQLDYPKRNYVFKIFAGLVYLCLQEAGDVSEVVIDKEYPSHEGDIKNFLLWLYTKENKSPPTINFDLVTKSSKAHIAAIETFRGNKKASKIVKAEDLVKLLYK